MFKSRLLGKADSLFQHPSGSINLHEFSVEWYELKPRFSDEIYEVNALYFTIAGQELLKHLEGFGQLKANIEIGLNLADRFGRVHDEETTTVHLIETADEWHEHAQTDTGMIVDIAAGQHRDGSDRAALRGVDPDSSDPDEVMWMSRPIELRYGRFVHSLFWELENLHDEAGDPIESVEILFRVGQAQADGTINWHGWQTVNGDAGINEHTFPEPPPQGSFVQSTGDFAQWQVKMRYATLFPTAYHRHRSPIRTAQLFLLGIRFQLNAPRRHFGSLAELMQQADTNSRIQANGWNGVDDFVFLRIPVSVELYGRFQESIGVRLTLKSDGASIPAWPTIFQVQGDVFMRFDEGV
ncbi:MAG: hypothetical protein KC419_08780 [Anaerolineales bacterium]|nr:hypothetical protein [Anaerolineales bacterium]MCA9928559.1 hypothetical protein [Anaerolineales bacterium]